MSTNRTLQEIDSLISDFGSEDIQHIFRDVFKSHLMLSEGYKAEHLAECYEVGTRLVDIFQAREKELQANQKTHPGK